MWCGEGCWWCLIDGVEVAFFSSFLFLSFEFRSHLSLVHSPPRTPANYSLACSPRRSTGEESCSSPFSYPPFALSRSLDPPAHPSPSLASACTVLQPLVPPRSSEVDAGPSSVRTIARFADLAERCELDECFPTSSETTADRVAPLQQPTSPSSRPPPPIDPSSTNSTPRPSPYPPPCFLTPYLHLRPLLHTFFRPLNMPSSSLPTLSIPTLRRNECPTTL